ncbi:hypothetical protein Dsin_016256 [Dipteronia sinensis]|uniref:Uncharacterized protein n=1 Tax=Dipteronia sinensis TaxID=43782 RepID=A0AAE0E5T5_9ROSI|nr:hypothetical protein Dsin_016256 [Dipteronia sinensis]
MGGCATKPKVLKSDESEIPAPAPDSATKEVVVVEEGEKVKEGGDVVGVVIDEAGKVKEIVVEENKVAAAADDDDLEIKPRSLSNLFKSEEEQDSTVFEEAPSEPLKEETKEFGEAPSKPLKEETTKEFEEAPSEPLKEETTKEFEEAPSEPLKEETTKEFEEAPSEPLKKETKEPEKPKEEPEKPKEEPEKLKEVSEAKPPEVEQQVAELPLSPTFVDAPEKAITEKAQEATPAAVTEINESPEKKIEEAK